ncbi:NAD-specific glutamate dehydrogenase [Vibrio cholerae]|nr:NAD-specific glutamate dehydrogenase [Vibrio cholerae]
MSVTVGRQNFEGFLAFNFIDLNDRDIECTTTKVIHRDSAITALLV